MTTYDDTAGQIMAHAFHDELEKIAISRAVKERALRAATHSADKLPFGAAKMRRTAQQQTFSSGLTKGDNLSFERKTLGHFGGYPRASAQQTRAAEIVSGIKKPKKTKTRVIQRSYGKSADGSVVHR